MEKERAKDAAGHKQRAKNTSTFQTLLAVILDFVDVTEKSISAVLSCSSMPVGYAPKPTRDDPIKITKPLHHPLCTTFEKGHPLPPCLFGLTTCGTRKSLGGILSGRSHAFCLI